ncbi:hypothetical protein GCM10010919_26860 [Alishewanella longhuensis]|uniref:diguanylate cyclase n=1 Tax=Alishewanella longhuensis TaxID=1091037 RepID=A0ABQ3L4Q0_9ALTE|nr:diguanylate cyclase [Alishewanella longhuensis]GHG73754.1 hypothetical protein GCM10010919_26860 [Alishewanella longhuensis]
MKKNNHADLSAAFAALRLRFEQGLPERAETMLMFVTESETSQLKSLLAEAHKLAGACGTFGYNELGFSARQIEQLVKTIAVKPADEQLQAFPLLKQAVLDFRLAVSAALAKQTPERDTIACSTTQPRTIWLLLPAGRLLDELSAQLEAFGHQILKLSSYLECFEQLQRQTPTVLFAAVSLSADLALFQQDALLKLLSKHQVRLVAYSEVDSFSLRIKAAQQRAEAFFISPLDIPNIITTVTELIEQESKYAGRVAIVEDDGLLAEHYELVLNAAGIQTHQVKHVPNIVSELMKFQPDLLLMDLYMPEFSGPEIAGLLRQYRNFKRLPIVFLSSELNKTLQIHALSHGGDDFLTKPIDDVLLVQSVKVRLARSFEIKNLIEKDSLTHLIKHSAIKDAADLEFERSERLQKPLSIVMLDIDYFKKVNDSYGHATGDVVITALATLLRKRIRKTDRAGRYGGEEFMLVLPDCAGEQARALVRGILDTFSQLQFSYHGDYFNCTFSAGVASTSDNSFSNAAELIEVADSALYQAKHAGRNQVC